ncbi:MAG: nitroreductase [Rhodoferax sp.]|nr:nitroreductase [Rhodoferax sp.]
MRPIPRKPEHIDAINSSLEDFTISDHPTPAQQHALDLLLSRSSPWPLTDPAPPDSVLNLAFDAALRAPDHGALRPWRFVVIRGAARDALGDLFAEAALARDPDANAERMRAKAHAAPIVVALGIHTVPGHKVPEIEQTMTVAAGAMNLLNALHILGYGGFWASGPNAYDTRVRQALGFGPTDRLAGFLYIGTPKEAVRPVPRPPRTAHVREWRGPA